MIIWVKEKLRKDIIVFRSYISLSIFYEVSKALLNKINEKIIEETTEGAQEWHAIEEEVLRMDKNRISYV